MPRRLPLMLTALALPFGAAACGGSGQSGSASAPTTTTSTTATPAGSIATTLARAVRTTIGAGSEHVRLVAVATAGGQSVRLTGSGDFDTAKHLGRLHASFSFGALSSTLNEVLDGQTLYLSSPLFSTLVPGAKKWLKLDLGRAAAKLGAEASALASQDPAAVLAQLKSLRTLHEVGTEELGGVETTHYRGRIDASASAGGGTGPADVWVDGDGRVRRVKVRYSAASGSQTAAATTVTTTLSDFGRKVSVTVPPASQTLDATNMSIPGLTGG